MEEMDVIDGFLQTFIAYIDSGFGLLQGDVAYLTSTLIVIDVTLAGLFWALSQNSDVIAGLLKKVLYVGFFAFILGNFALLSNILFETVCSIGDYALVCHDEKDKPLTSGRRALERIRTFVLANLTDPNLSVSMIADRLNMSPRYVHSAFEGSQWTVKSWIKHRRLLECRKAIRSPSMVGRTLTEIAYSWGFSDFSHFSRCYKEKFGCSPKHDRAAAE